MHHFALGAVCVCRARARVRVRGMDQCFMAAMVPKGAELVSTIRAACPAELARLEASEEGGLSKEAIEAFQRRTPPTSGSPLGV